MTRTVLTPVVEVTDGQVSVVFTVAAGGGEVEVWRQDVTADLPPEVVDALGG